MTADLRVLPDYLIIGGKRCGTTSLQSYISRHPAVMPTHSGKGTRYFDTNYSKGVRWFRGHYPLRATSLVRRRLVGEGVITGEASPYYCFHPRAPQRMAQLVPHARLIFVVRDPVERAFSHHSHETRLGYEHLPLDEALDREAERLAGESERLEREPEYVSFAHRHWSYQARGQYAEQLDEVGRWFPPEQVLVLAFHDLSQDARGVLARIFDFLGLSHADIGPLPVLKSGDGSRAPRSLRERLEPVFAGSNARLAEEHGIDLG